MVLIIDDDIAVRTSLLLLLQNAGYQVQSAGNPEAALLKMDDPQLELVVLDLNFSIDTSGREGMLLLSKIRQKYPDIPVILITGWATIQLAVEGMKLGARDFINKPWDNEHLLQSVRTLLQLTEKKISQSRRQPTDHTDTFNHIVGEDPAMVSILDTVSNVAPTNASVLIMGESGTGKELIAEAIHQNSNRSSKPFVKVNLGGISTSLFESEMFGHVRGAFTDARTDRIGRFEMANKGTIFLDEIGDLDPASQVKLLRVLQDRTYEVLGSSRTKTVDVRVICATNRNIDDMVASGLFREDLLYRINLVTIKLPALRERSADIPALVDFFLGNLKEIYNKPRLHLTTEAIKWLSALPLPGNIRQLKNLVERTVLASKGDVLDIEDFKIHVEPRRENIKKSSLPEVGELTIEEMEILMIRKAMEYHRNKISKAARSLGLTRSALYRRLDKYRIPYDEASD